MQLPEDFIRETRLLMGEDRFNRFLGAFDEEAPVSIRINPRYSRSEECGVWSEKCSEAESAPESNLTPHSSLLTPQIKVPWCPEGFYLSGRPQFTFDPLFHAGCYYVQEAASMFVTHILRAVANSCVPSVASGIAESSLFTLHSSLNVLDLCAAPGGKSTAMRTVLPEGSILVSNEPNPTRAQILLENITKWGWPDCIVTNNYPRDFRKAKAKFDLILCDVPCSGEGMFRKDPQAISEWSLQSVEKCWRLQREIVADAWECLNPGGLLIYSTCTFNIKEDEENVRWIIDNYDAEPLTIPTRYDYRQMKGLSILVPPLHRTPVPPTIDLPYSDALKYLRGEALVLPPGTPQGIVTVTYKGVPLGPVKNIGSRANNLYPKPWRIKTTHLPTEPVVIICKP